MSIPSVSELVRNPWFQLTGFFVGLAGIVIAAITYVVTRRYKRIWYGVRSFTLVRRERSTIPGLEVTFEKKPVEALTISKVVLWNSGKDPLGQSDFPSNEPLLVEVKKAFEILEAFIVQATAPSCGCEIKREARNSFKITFEFLDPRDGLVVQIAHTGSSSEDVQITGRIVGRGKIARCWPSRRVRMVWKLLPLTISRVAWVWLIGFMGLLMIGLAWLPPRRGLAGELLMSGLGMVYCAMAWSAYRRRPPRGLERYDDELRGSKRGSSQYNPPVAPQFSSRREAADWVIKQAALIAGSARFKASMLSDHEIDLDFDRYWLTLDQIKRIVNLGKENGFQMTASGKGLILATPEMKQDVIIREKG